jgi:hypothetical protein
MWKEVVMAYFKELSQHPLGGTKESHIKPVRIICISAKIRSKHLLNKSEKHYC